MKFRVSRLIIPFLCFILLLSPSLIQSRVEASPEILDIDIITEKQTYNVNEQVTVSTNITLDGNPMVSLAAMEIQNPYENPYIIRTVATGDPSGIYFRVQILDVYTCDAQGKPRTTFNPGTFAYVNLTIKNADNYNSYPLKVAIYIQSSSNAPLLAFYPTQIEIQKGQQISSLVSIQIPVDAPQGEAKIFASLFTDSPKNMGYPYSPEKTATFYITTTTPTMPPQPQYYNVTFNFPQGNVTAGNYTIYATAHYVTQTKIEIKKITLNGPIAIISYNPANPLVCQAITFNASNSYSPYGSITSWYWNFGDGITRNGAIVIHAYDTAGTYKMNLTLTDVLGVESVSLSYIITVSEAWPMFRHDPKNTATSTSLSPVINSTKWLKVIGSVDSDVWMCPSPIVNPTTSENIVYAASKNGTIYALKGSSGETFWSKTLPVNKIYSSPAFAEGLIFIGSDNGKVYAVNATNGETQYTITTGASIYSSPTIFENKVYIGALDAKVYAFYINGTTLWTSTTLDGAIYSSPAVANEKIYVGTSNGTIYALDETTGAVVWSKTPTIARPIYASPSFAYGSIFIGSTDNNIYALNSENGDILWNVTIGGEAYSSPAVANGIVFVGSLSGNLYALNASTGALIWLKTIGQVKWSSPLIAEGKVFIGTTDGSLYALREKNGYTLWSYKTNGAIDSSPALLNEILYICSKDGKIYSINGQTHNIAITYITPSKTLVKYTENVTINVSLWNKGSFSETVMISGYCENVLFYSNSVIMPRGVELILPMSLNTGTLTEGNYTILANATLTPPIVDGDLSDNVLSCEIRVEYGDISLINVIPSTPGVNITQLIPTKTVVGRGYGTTVYVTVGNKGNFTEHNIQVTIYWSNGTSLNQVINDTTISELPIGTSVTVNVTWEQTFSLSYGNYTISAYAWPVLGESNTADNDGVAAVQVHIGVPGDVSSPQFGVPDGIVNMRDASYCILLFNTKPGSPNWKPNADINNDGIVNMRDTVITILNFNHRET